MKKIIVVLLCVILSGCSSQNDTGVAQDNSNTNTIMSEEMSEEKTADTEKEASVDNSEVEQPEMVKEDEGYDISNLIAFEYTDLSYDFEWGENSTVAQTNKNAVGSCRIGAKLVGDYTEVTKILITAFSEKPFTQSSIANKLERMVEVWNNSDMNFEGEGNLNSFRGSFPIRESNLGMEMYVLEAAMNKDGALVGYVILPIKVPSSSK